MGASDVVPRLFRGSPDVQRRMWLRGKLPGSAVAPGYRSLRRYGLMPAS